MIQTHRKDYVLKPMNHLHIPKKEKKLGRALGLGYITAGAFFLFDPYISIVDLLPDALGYLFIFLGLYRMADLDDRLSEALKGARNLAFAGLARVAAMLLAFGVVSPAEQPVFMLLALFSLAVVDCLLFVPMWKNLCGGLLYLGSRYDATAMFDRRGLRGKTRIYNMVERYTTLSTVFFILREALAVLPELTVLSHEKGGAELGQGTRYYDFVGLFRMAGITLSLILGIVWLILTIRFVRRLKSDAPFFARLTEKYKTEILPRHDLFARRAVKSGMICLIAAAALTMDFYLDGVNLAPDFLAAILMFLSILFLTPYAGKNVPARALTMAYGISAAVSWVMQFKYFGMNDMADIFYLDEINARWRITVLLQFVTGALFVLAMGGILKSLFAMVQRYTGVRTFRDGSPYASERSEAIHNLIRKKLLLVMVFTGLVALSALFQWGAAPQLAELDLFGHRAGEETTITTLLAAAYQLLTEGYWFFDLCIGAALIGVTVSATSEITEQMEYSSMMQN